MYIHWNIHTVRCSLKSIKTKLFDCGNSQAVRLPKGFDFSEGGEVYLTRDALTGDVLISKRPSVHAWSGFFGLIRTISPPAEYLVDRPLNVLLNDVE